MVHPRMLSYRGRIGSWRKQHPVLWMTIATTIATALVVTSIVLLGAGWDRAVTNAAFVVLFMGASLYFSRKRIQTTEAKPGKRSA